MNRYNRQWIWYIQFGKEGWRTNVAEATLNRCPTLPGARNAMGLCFTIWFRDLVTLYHVLEFWGPHTKACFLVWRNTCRISASVFAGKHRHWHRQADLRRGQLHRDLSACWQTMSIAVELSCKYSHTVCANVLGTTLGLQTGPYIGKPLLRSTLS